MNNRHAIKKTTGKLGMNLFTLVFVVSIIAPFVWLALAAFKNMRELYASPVQILPSEINLNNFIEAFTVQPLAQYILNSVLVSLISTALIIIIGCMASFALARTPIRGKKLILLLLLTITLLPPITLLNPIYLMMNKLGLLNTQVGLALVLVAIELPSAVWYLMTFFQTIPGDMEESAMIDGATIPQTFVRILLPIVSPGIFTISIMDLHQHLEQLHLCSGAQSHQGGPDGDGGPDHVFRRHLHPLEPDRRRRHCRQSAPDRDGSAHPAADHLRHDGRRSQGLRIRRGSFENIPR